MLNVCIEHKPIENGVLQHSERERERKREKERERERERERKREREKEREDTVRKIGMS